MENKEFQENQLGDIILIVGIAESSDDYNEFIKNVKRQIEYKNLKESIVTSEKVLMNIYSYSSDIMRIIDDAEDYALVNKENSEDEINSKQSTYIFNKILESGYLHRDIEEIEEKLSKKEHLVIGFMLLCSFIVFLLGAFTIYNLYTVSLDEKSLEKNFLKINFESSIKKDNEIRTNSISYNGSFLYNLPIIAYNGKEKIIYNLPFDSQDKVLKILSSCNFVFEKGNWWIDKNNLETCSKEDSIIAIKEIENLIIKEESKKTPIRNSWL